MMRCGTIPTATCGFPSRTTAGYVAVERTSLVACGRRDPGEGRGRFRQRYGAQRAYTDYREMIEREQLDIVSVATRPATHPGDRRLCRPRHGVKGILLRKAPLLLNGRG